MATRSASEVRRRSPWRSVEDLPHEPLVLGRGHGRPIRHEPGEAVELAGRPRHDQAVVREVVVPAWTLGPDEVRERERVALELEPARLGAPRRRRWKACAGRHEQGEGRPRARRGRQTSLAPERVLPPPTTPAGVAEVRHRPSILGVGPGVRQRPRRRPRTRGRASPAFSGSAAVEGTPGAPAGGR